MVTGFSRVVLQEYWAHVQCECIRTCIFYYTVWQQHTVQYIHQYTHLKTSATFRFHFYNYGLTCRKRWSDVVRYGPVWSDTAASTCAKEEQSEVVISQWWEHHACSRIHHRLKSLEQVQQNTSNGCISVIQLHQNEMSPATVGWGRGISWQTHHCWWSGVK